MARMSSYAPLPVGDPDELHNAEMEAAFDDSDSDGDDDERRPLAPSARQSHHVSTHSVGQPDSPTTYDFNRQDDWIAPPPGSPPRPSERALPNDYGNSNGLVPTSPPSRTTPSRPWFSRFIPSLFTPSQRPTGPVGSGANNDGVFANVTAKPSRQNMVETTAADGSIHLAPEETSSMAPPSYQSAQADAVPPYWETTVHITGYAGQNLTVGELIIDSLPTGSLMSFLWNMLVSVSFQFVGFLLTYLLHSTHAARLGSRAGLGVTLIQYGFSLRKSFDDPSTSEEANAAWQRIQDWRESLAANFTSAADAAAYYQETNSTIPTLTEEEANALIADATTEWLSFFLMTVGWFVLLTSILQFFRVKRWERGIIASQLENPNANDRPTGELPVLTRLQRAMGIPSGTSASQFFRRGLGIGASRTQDGHLERAEEGRSENPAPLLPPPNIRPPAANNRRENDELDDDELILETDRMMPLTEEEQHALDNDRRVFTQLRQAGFL